MTNEPTLIFRDKHDSDAIRVEFFDDDGGCEVAQFSGPRARERALAFGKAFYGKVDIRDRLEAQ
jgi:hypothetical protein